MEELINELSSLDNESLDRDSVLNSILDNNSYEYNESDVAFLKNFDERVGDSYILLSKNKTIEVINFLATQKRTIVSLLEDRDGVINEAIISVENNIDNETAIINTKNTSFTIRDRNLYDIKYNPRKDVFLLTLNSEYIEKLLHEN